MKAFAGEALFAEIAERGARLRYLARHADTDAPAKPLTRPDPRPDPKTFPDQLSVTRIETLLRDPYAIFAQYVLGLDPLPDLAAAPGPGGTRHPGARAGGAFRRSISRHAAARSRDGAGDDAGDSPTRSSRLMRKEFPDIHADWLPRLTPHRHGPGRLGISTPRSARAGACRIEGRDGDPVRQPHLQTHGAGRPDRAAPRRGRHRARFQIRQAALGKGKSAWVSRRSSPSKRRC